MTSKQTEPDLFRIRFRFSLLDLTMTSSPPNRFGSDLQLIDVWVEDPINETNTRGLKRVLIGELNVDFPNAIFERG